MTACRTTLGLLTVLGCAVLLTGSSCDGTQAITVGSKLFTESVILGEIATQLAVNAGADATHRRETGGSTVLWEALKTGQIDAYPEYTGTLRQEILSQLGLESDEELAAALARYGVAMSRPLGFSNTYVLGMRKARAAELGITRISDLTQHPALRFGFSNEFLERGDGWQQLRAHYGLPQEDVRGLDHNLAYQGLGSGALDLIDVYSTDPEIQYYDLAILEDDRSFFPDYDAIWLYRQALVETHPEAVAAWGRITGRISAETMQALNGRAKPPGDQPRVPESQVAADFLRDELQIESRVTTASTSQQILARTGEHLYLVFWSMLPAILTAIPLGVVAAKYRTTGQGILGVVGILQTIPSLALLVLLIKPLYDAGAALEGVLGSSFGLTRLGEPQAIVALFLYSLLPIVRNTAAGISGIAHSVRESAEALGLTRAARLLRVELPLASGVMLAGIKTAAVINVGFATLGALIGAGGYGQPILTGIRLADYSLVLQGAVPAAVLAVVVQGVFELLERVVVPRGLRLRRS